MSPKPVHLILYSSGIRRKEAFSLVLSGRVSVNGKQVTDHYFKADSSSGDIVTLDEKLVIPEQKRYVLINKPRGVLCAMSDESEWRGKDPENNPKFERRKLISSLIPDGITERLGDAGRLDLDSEGLVLLTNDRWMMQQVKRPGGTCWKRYIVTVLGKPSEKDIKFLREGPTTIGNMGQLLPCKIDIINFQPPLLRRIKKVNDIQGLTELQVELQEGKKNQIRRMFGFIGHRVIRLIRVSVGPLKLEAEESSLLPGEARELRVKEVENLRNIFEKK